MLYKSLDVIIKLIHTIKLLVFVNLKILESTMQILKFAKYSVFQNRNK